VHNIQKKFEIEDVKILEDPFRAVCTSLRQKMMGYMPEAEKSKTKEEVQSKEAKMVDKITKTETAKKIVFM
jgi:hypothetical protein